MLDPVTRLLGDMEAGRAGAEEDLLALVYAQLRGQAARIMSDQHRGHTLQPTALVHEAYVKLVRGERHWESRKHFFSVAAKAMRQVLTDHARSNLAAKRGGARQRVTLSGSEGVEEEISIDLIALSEALEGLRARSPRHADIAELRFLTGCSVAEVADSLELSERTVKSGWRAARAWLRDALDGEGR